MSSLRPNILLITTDQQRTDSLGCYGSDWMGTPHLDALAASGICCDRAYTTSPVCTPARISLFTGLQVSRHGAWNIGVNAPEETRTIAHRLTEQGYRTHNIGKMHFQSYASRSDQSRETVPGWRGAVDDFSGPYFGFQTIELAIGHATYGLRGHYGTWVRAQVGEEVYQSYQKAASRSSVGFGCEAYDWDLPTRLHNSVWTADRAIDFLRQHDSSQPFFLTLGFQDPHHPHCVPRDFTDRVKLEDVPPPDYDEGELEDKPPHFGHARRGDLEASAFRGDYPVAGQEWGHDYRRPSESEKQQGRAYYYNLVRLLDQQMGRILNYLEETGLSDNTLVVFTTDHGELLGDHGLWMKGPYHYEQLVRVPLLMRWPRGFSGGRRIPAIVSHLDLVPTLLAAAESPEDPGLDGTNALPLFQGRITSIRDGAMIECVDDPHKLRLKTYVTPDRKLTWYNGQTFGELYDLVRDPREKVNLWDNPEYAREKSRLLGRLLEKLEPLEKRGARHAFA